MKLLRRLLPALLLVPLAAACSDSSSAQPDPTKLRLGYFANVTHATPLVGVAKGYFADALGDVKLETQVFNAGPAAIEALFAGSIDATYIGPNPAINGFVKSKGEALRIVAGATSGGASLVVRPGITGAAQLKGARLATPQLGNTQDVALRAWLKAQGLKTTTTGTGGDVVVAPTDNATTLQLFRDGKIAGAWVPEPWASRLVLEGGGTVLVDERSLWPSGAFVTTHLIVSAKYLKANPGVVRKLVGGQVATNAWINANVAEAKTVVNAELLRLTTKQLPQAVIDRAFANITVTDDPIAASLATSAEHAADAGFLKAPKLSGIYDLSILNAALAAAGRPTVTVPPALGRS